MCYRLGVKLSQSNCEVNFFGVSMNKRIFTNEFFDSLRKHLDNSKQKYVAYPKFILKRLSL